MPPRMTGRVDVWGSRLRAPVCAARRLKYVDGIRCASRYNSLTLASAHLRVRERRGKRVTIGRNSRAGGKEREPATAWRSKWRAPSGERWQSGRVRCKHIPDADPSAGWRRRRVVSDRRASGSVGARRSTADEKQQQQRTDEASCSQTNKETIERQRKRTEGERGGRERGGDVCTGKKVRGEEDAKRATSGVEQIANRERKREGEGGSHG